MDTRRAVRGALRTLSLIDSNVLVYAFDPSDRTKQSRALQLLAALLESRQAAVSVQCLSEFYRVTTTRLAVKLGPVEALQHVTQFAESCFVLDLTRAALLEGVRAAVDYQMSVWDGLIWAVARSNRIANILTEDTSEGRVIEGVRYYNPFLPEFELSLITG